MTAVTFVFRRSNESKDWHKDETFSLLTSSVSEPVPERIEYKKQQQKKSIAQVFDRRTGAASKSDPTGRGTGITDLKVL